MSESVLKREFKQEDIQRLRNLIQGKYGEKTRTSVGFNRKEEQHYEGDVWEEDEKKWTIINGIKQNITKLDKIDLFPLFCPKCGKVMKNRNDKTFYPIHGMCFNCVIELETQLKSKGKWEEYEKQIKNNEIDNRIKELKLWVEEQLNESNNYFSEEGIMDNWKGGLNKEQIKEYVLNATEYLEN